MKSLKPEPWFDMAFDWGKIGRLLAFIGGVAYFVVSGWQTVRLEMSDIHSDIRSIGAEVHEMRVVDDERAHRLETALLASDLRARTIEEKVASLAAQEVLISDELHRVQRNTPSNP